MKRGFIPLILFLLAVIPCSADLPITFDTSPFSMSHNCSSGCYVGNGLQFRINVTNYGANPIKVLGVRIVDGTYGLTVVGKNYTFGSTDEILTIGARDYIIFLLNTTVPKPLSTRNFTYVFCITQRPPV
jgi:hypothetical protein